MTRVKCEICPHNCSLAEGQKGICNARSNQNGVICNDNYGLITSIALDPIEKKPLNRFYPGSKILSVGSYGCNFKCPFCQNYEISMADKDASSVIFISPEDLVKKALELVPYGNIGIAYTYNEPVIWYEYVRDCSRLAAENNLKNVLVTNGYINKKPLLELLPFIHAMNIDLKSFTEGFYKKVGGDPESVKQTVALASEHCHVEVTTLIIPEENDSPEEMHKLAGWLSSISRDIPLHISRFFPRYKMSHKEPTPISTIYSLADIAREYLTYVYEGNV